MFGKKKKKTTKNKSKTFVDGKEQDVPEKIPDLEIPVPPQEEKVEQPLQAQAVYDAGRSVGFQEGMIYAVRLIDDHLKQHQEVLRKKIAEKEQEAQQ